MPRSINGVGTHWYGHALPKADGSYVVTEWFTFLWIPLLPLGSKRILWDEQRHREQDAKPWWNREVGVVSYYKALKVPLYMPHVIKGYVVTIGIALLITALQYLPI